LDEAVVVAVVAPFVLPIIRLGSGTSGVPPEERREDTRTINFYILRRDIGKSENFLNNKNQASSYDEKNYLKRNFKR
jgi:hypothetical protein